MGATMRFPSIGKIDQSSAEEIDPFSWGIYAYSGFIFTDSWETHSMPVRLFNDNSSEIIVGVTARL